MKEVWRDTVGFDRYQVSNLGRVKCSNSEYVLNPWPIGRYGHLYVKLYMDGGFNETCSVSRLVLEAFVGPRPEGMQACHFPDRDPSNNNLSNLRWDTSKENMKDRAIHKTHARGSRSVKSKLFEYDIPIIRKRLKETEGVWGAMSVIARDYKVDAATIRDIRDNVTWKHVPL